MSRRCPLCGGPDHEDIALCPAYMEAESGDGGPIAFGMDPYAMFDPQTQIKMQQLAAASSEQTALLTKMLALAAEQTAELKALKVEVVTLRSRALPGGRMRALPPARPAFCAYCGGPLTQCQPTCPGRERDAATREGEQMNDDDTKVEHPAHYGGNGNPHEAILVIEAWDVRFCLGNALKYLSRAGKKDGQHLRYDLKKAAWYLNRVRSSSRDYVTPLIQRTLPVTMHADAVAAAWGLEPPLAAVLKAVFEGNTAHAHSLLREHIAGLG